MQARQPGPRLAHQSAQHRFHLVGIKAKFAVEVPRADVLMRMALDPRGKAQHQPNGGAVFGNEGREAVEVVLVVHHHCHVVVVSKQQLLIGFVVAVQHHPIAWHATAERCE